jgi:outer membrane protein assembly factor BamE (lipoprotein component of BamABCDE complex)
VPSYGEPQPRPAYEALRTVKRGMTSDEVARLVGTPSAMESNSTGGYVWDYGYGRTITFDRRNRAVGLSGFPAP